MIEILDTISRNYLIKMDIAHARGKFDMILQYVDEKENWETSIKTALTKTLTRQEGDYIEIMQTFFEIEHKFLIEKNLEEKQQRELQLDIIKYNILTYTRRYLISEENNKTPILGIINGQTLREINDIFFEEDYITNGMFDEDLRLEKNYFDQDFNEEQEEVGEENKENTPRRSGEVTAIVLSPFLNSIRGDIKKNITSIEVK